MKNLLLLAALLILGPMAVSQDVRSRETEVADLLARMPVYNSNELERQMKEMTRMGSQGRERILLLLKVPGSGDDTHARFAVESYSRYLSVPERRDQSAIWESECIAFFRRSALPEIKEFMLAQLRYSGGSQSAQLAVENIQNELMCESSAALLMATGTAGVEDQLIALLEDNNLSCAAGIMNCLSGDIADSAIQQLMGWYSRGDQDEKRAAISAISRSTGAAPYHFLREAAEKNGFGAGYTGETDALINFAFKAGERGDTDVPAEVAALLLRRPLTPGSVHYRKAALTLLVEYQGEEALSQLIREFRSGDVSIRRTAINLAGRIPGESVTARLCSLVREMPPGIASDIVAVIGLRGDRSASEPLSVLLFNSVPEIRIPGIKAYARLEGSESVETIIDYMRSYPYYEDQSAAVEALTFTADSGAMQKIAAAIADSPPVTKANMIMFVASGGESIYFPMMAQYCNSQDKLVSDAAYDALPRVAGPGNIEMLISMALQSRSEERVGSVVTAIARSVEYSDNPANVSELFSQRVEKSGYNRNLVAALPLIGDIRSAECILKAFEAGDAESREFIYSLMEQWPEIEIVHTLYEIVASGNKSYQDRAFSEYCRKVGEGNIPGEQKLLLARRIEPWATSDERRLMLINAVKDIRSFTGMVWLSGYLDNDDVIAREAAGIIIDIALPGEDEQGGFTGEMAMEILKKAVRMLKDSEKAARAEARVSSISGEEGFVSMFNGRDLDGWQGLVENPIARSRMTDRELAGKQAAADMEMTKNWSVDRGAIWFSGNGANLCSVEEYGDFELLVDWRITKNGDSGIYLRGTPQVQIWDTSLTDVGAEVGSGGLYNNQEHKSRPLVVADNPVTQWNSFRIVMKGEVVSVWLNGILVVDEVVMENYWDRSRPIFRFGPVELQAHGNELAFRDIYIRKFDRAGYGITPEEMEDGFVSLFNGYDLDNWTGNKNAYSADNGTIVVRPQEGSGGNLYTEREYDDFNFRFDFQLTPGANNGLGIRTPITGDPAYVGMELQILDNTAPVYAGLEPYQYHGSVYGVIPARRGYLNPVGEWNSQEVIVEGTRIRVILNGTTIVDGDISDAIRNGTMDHNEHPGLLRDRGHIGFLGHGSVVRFRNIRIKEL
ncbi:MAG: DUF1080 domain-containing protein [Bacteroidales bacterium]|nr:DUF1080 domain-containing protein [Bacteroidales bacterium]